MSEAPATLIQALSSKQLLEFAKVRVIALDLDGTTVASGADEVLEKIADQVKLLSRKKIQIVVATGRTLRKARQVLVQLGIDRNTPVILFNGAVVTNTDGVEISLTKLPAAAVAELSAFAVRHNKYLLLYRFLPKDMVRQEAVEEVVGVGPLHGRFVSDFNGLDVEWKDSVSSEIDTFNTALIVGCDEVPSLQLVGVDATSSGSEFVEIRPENTNKGRALSEISERYRVHRDNVLAIGDNDNDFEMLAWAGLSIVPATASPPVKEIATLVSGHGQQNVVVDALRLVIDARRFWDELQKVRS